MKNIFVPSLTLLLGVNLLFVSCRQQEAPPEQDESAPAAGNIILTAEQIKQAGITFGTFQDAELSHDVYAKGKLTLPNNRMAEVSTTVGGIVSRISLHQGAYVRRNQAVVRLVHPDIIKIQQDYLNARYTLDAATEQFDRLKLLISEDIASKKSYQAAERDYLTAKTNYDALKMHVRLAGFDLDSLDSGNILDYLDIRSPITGNINGIKVFLGQYVTPGNPLFEVVDKSDLHIELMVFEKDIPFVNVGQRVTLTLSNIGEQVYEAEVFTVGSTMEEMARTIPVLAHFRENPGNSFPGMFVAGTIHTGESIFSALPEEALVAEKEGENYIYYTLDDYRNSPSVGFKKIMVMPGLIEDGFASMELVEPLPEGAHIVVSGGYYIRSVFVRSVE